MGNQDREYANPPQQDAGQEVPGGVPATPLDVAADPAGARSVAGAAPKGGPLETFGDENEPGTAGMSSAGDTLADDTDHDLERADTISGDTAPSDGGESVPPKRRT